MSQVFNKIMIPAMFCVAASAFVSQAAKHEPYDRSRIYWDMSTRVDAMGWGGNYGRMVQLLDGRLMIVGIPRLLSAIPRDSIMVPRILLSLPTAHCLWV